MNIATMKTYITSAWGKWVILLSVFLALGATAGLYILTQGLAATNLTDLVPWGFGSPLIFPPLPSPAGHSSCAQGSTCWV